MQWKWVPHLSFHALISVNRWCFKFCRSNIFYLLIIRLEWCRTIIMFLWFAMVWHMWVFWSPDSNIRTTMLLFSISKVHFNGKLILIITLFLHNFYHKYLVKAYLHMEVFRSRLGWTRVADKGRSWRTSDVLWLWEEEDILLKTKFVVPILYVLIIMWTVLSCTSHTVILIHYIMSQQ